MANLNIKGSTRAALDYVKGQGDQGGTDKPGACVAFVKKIVCCGCTDAPIANDSAIDLNDVIVEDPTPKEASNKPDSSSSSGVGNKVIEDEDVDSESEPAPPAAGAPDDAESVVNPGQTTAKAPGVIKKAWVGKNIKKEGPEELALARFDSVETQALEESCKAFEDALRESMPPGGLKFGLKFGLIGMLAMGPYVARIYVLRDMGLKEYDPTEAAVVGALTAGFADVILSHTIYPQIAGGASDSPHLAALNKQWSVAIAKGLDAAAGVPNDSEFPLNARQYAASQMRVVVTEHLPFWSFMLSNTALYFAKPPEQLTNDDLTAMAGIVMSGISVMALQLSRATYPSKFFKPTLLGEYASKQAEMLRSRRKDLEEAHKTASNADRVEIDRQLKKTNKMLKEAESCISRLGFMWHQTTTLFTTRNGWAEMLGRTACLMPVAIAMYIAAERTDDPDALPTAAQFVIGSVLGFGPRNGYATMVEVGMASVQAGGRVLGRIWNAVAGPEQPQQSTATNIPSTATVEELEAEDEAAHQRDDSSSSSSSSSSAEE